MLPMAIPIPDLEVKAYTTPRVTYAVQSLRYNQAPADFPHVCQHESVGC